MAGITTLNVDDDLKPRLIERAVKHGHAMEVEAPQMLEAALVGRQPAAAADNLYDAILSIVAPLGRRRDGPINDFDARIAAIACALSLATPDTREFVETGAQTIGLWQL
jgi:plasmid stability protein